MHQVRSEVTILWESGSGVGYNTETDENNECVIAKYVMDSNIT